jgi:hypothetical protein
LVDATGTPPPSPYRVPDSWGEDLVNEPSSAESQIGQAVIPDEELPTPQQAELLEAWMNKRKAIRMEEMQQHRVQTTMDPRTGGFQQATSGSTMSRDGTPSQQPHWFVQRPVDVDTGVEILDKEEDLLTSYIPTATATIVGEDAQTVSSKHEQGSIASYPSNSTSDMTPIVSNKRLFYARQRPSQSASVGASLSTAQEAVHGGGEQITEAQNETEEPTGCRKQCRAFLDLRTYHGKLALLLLMILILAVTTMVVSALLAQQSKSIIDGNDGISTVVTRSPTVSTSPSMQPTSLSTSSTQAPTLTSSGDDIPSSTIIPPGVTTSVPTISPSVVPTTLLPTFGPTADPFESITLTQGDLLLGPTDDSEFGSAIALSGDGTTLVIGAPSFQRRLGRVEIFELVQGQWMERYVIAGTVAQGDLGESVAVSQDGLIVAIAQPGFSRRQGRVVVYNYNPASGAYLPLGDPMEGSLSNGYFGNSISLSADGLRIAIGAPYYSGINGQQMHGQVSVYEFDGNNWTLMGTPMYGGGTLDWLGYAVDLSNDGLHLVASAPRNSNLDGYVGTWQWNPALLDWEKWGTGDIFNAHFPALSSDRFGDVLSLSITPNGTPRLAVGIPSKSVELKRSAGMVVVYELNSQTTTWNQAGEPILQDIPTANVETGSSVQLIDGDILLVGLPGALGGLGQLNWYQYTDSTKVWEPHPVPLQGSEPATSFGSAVTGQSNNGLAIVVGGNSFVQYYFEE